MNKPLVVARDWRVRLVVSAVGVLVLISLVWISLARIPGWLDETLQEAVDGALQGALEEVDESLREVLEVNSSAAVEEAVEEALRRFDESVQEALSRLSSPTEAGRTRGRPQEPAQPPPLSRAEAILLVKFNISMMTRRYSADAIEDAQTLQDVDIDTQAKVEYFKGRLAASLRANLGGSLDETRFQNSLQLSTRSTVAVVGSGLQRAYRMAWFSN